jgi:hypothetical protein
MHNIYNDYWKHITIQIIILKDLVLCKLVFYRWILFLKIRKSIISLKYILFRKKLLFKIKFQYLNEKHVQFNC